MNKQPSLFDAEEEHFEERAAILEHDAGMDKLSAEKAAKEEVERHKFQCMVRQLLTWKVNGEYKLINDWLNKQDQKTMEIYINATREQWQLGNRGEYGVWMKGNKNG